MQDFRNLSVWQRARRLTKSVYEMTAGFPGSEEFGLKSQMRRATVSICSNIAEGCGRMGDRETIFSYDLAFITEAAQDAILDTVIQIKRMLGGLLSRLGWGRIPDPPRRAASPQAEPGGKADG